MTTALILASSSAYRQQLLGKLHLPFTVMSPDIDESARDSESAAELVERLAVEKARAVVEKLGQEKNSSATPAPDKQLVIGSDQVAVIDNEILGKPHSHERALQQLRRSQGKRLCFLTGLCLYNADSGQYQSAVEPFYVHFRELPDTQLERYLLAEQPYDCAGSFKCEGLGISLFERLEGDDPNTLVWLPLIRLILMLQLEGVALSSGSTSRSIG